MELRELTEAGGVKGERAWRSAAAAVHKWVEGRRAAPGRRPSHLLAFVRRRWRWRGEALAAVVANRVRLLRDLRGSLYISTAFADDVSHTVRRWQVLAVGVGYHRRRTAFGDVWALYDDLADAYARASEAEKLQLISGELRDGEDVG